ncbi:S10 family peptidase [Amphiplicatus metriothermophilus]|uniref:Carboxypeptidase C (Cathepsin A) n=1 Tax=Amphiplicatus metriothermophilus TaxID=1519374 RepID=A0A239PUZ9_9PROT|nr:septum formation initiator [Amphiplicatus metriothermophilus]MBB5519565.1 carboxypeptidase C (cathepsin A) [Amphiplicatus metriothermophilus]SNT74129.1 Carboxypeptidase C (cathepsin A) [Amphiplicatus metriothermophilus]
MRPAYIITAGFIAALAIVAIALRPPPQILQVATPAGTPGAQDSAAVRQAPAPLPLRIVTDHVAEIGGERIDYRVIAGETVLRDLAGEPVASVFSFAYMKTNPADRARPVLFVFNGGPGSSSLWLHMGAIGPRRVALDQEVNPGNTPPFGVANNPHSLLDVADLVFIDPVGTGFSRAIGKGKPEDFWGVDEDANAVAQFIELWLTEHGRWNAPKFIMGESYGSARAAMLPRALMGGPFYTGVMRGITVNGVILLGTTLEGRGENGARLAAEDKAMEAALVLPGLAATAWFHEKVDRRGLSLPAFYEEAMAFAKTRYAEALRAAEAGALDGDARAEVVRTLVSYTGLPEEAFEEELGLSASSFAKKLLAEEGLAIGLYDSRYTLPLANSGGDPVADDPAMGRYVPGFIAAFHQMLRDDLKVTLDRPYGAIVWKDLLQKWNWSRAGVEKGQSFAVDLAWAMRRTPKLRVLIASGYYDLVTTPAEARSALAEADLPADRVEFRIYESGHMLYLGDTAESFANDVRRLIETAR